MKNHAVTCCDPFKSHKKKIVNGVVMLPKNVYNECQRHSVDIAENELICVNCLKKLQLQNQNHRKLVDFVLMSKTELNTSNVDTNNFSLVCCDPFNTHKKVIKSGVGKLPLNVYLECQNLGIVIDRDATICINCLKKCQRQSIENNIDSIPRSSIKMVRVKTCIDPFKTHKKIITSGLYNFPRKLHQKCHKIGIDVTADSFVCVNCLKKLQRGGFDKMAMQSPPHYMEHDKTLWLESSVGVSPTECDLSITNEHCDEVVPSMTVGQCEVDNLFSANQGSKIVSNFMNGKPSQKRKLTYASSSYSFINSKQHSKKSRKITRYFTAAADIANMNGTSTKGGRGALIVLEGCDRTGKTTQANKMVESLKAAGKAATFMRFPDRTTKIGSIIDSYLSCSSELEDHSIHLLFSANRWELLPKIMSTLNSGISIIIDRYAFSGVAFSGAKEGMSLEWCKQSDIGLPKPDLVLFLNLSAEEAQRRSRFGEERYEKADFQKRVYNNYRLLQDDSWKVIDANKSIDDLQNELMTEVLKVIDVVQENKIGKLWI